MNRARAIDPVEAAEALFESHRRPRQVVENHGLRELEVEALLARRVSDEHARGAIRGEVGEQFACGAADGAGAGDLHALA